MIFNLKFKIIILNKLGFIQEMQIETPSNEYTNQKVHWNSTSLPQTYNKHGTVFPL